MIPDKQIREECCATDARHTFVLKGGCAKLRLHILDRNHKPRSGLQYTVSINGSTRKGTTDGNGLIEETIAPATQKVTVYLREDARWEKYELNLGHVDPIDNESGPPQRLTNLGLGGRLRPKTALLWFQKKYGLRETGELDPQTVDRLKSIHGC